MLGARQLTLAALAALLAVVAVGCSRGSGSSLPTPSNAFCEAATKYDKRLPKFEGATRYTDQIELVRPMAEHAPKDIKKDAARFLDALERRAAGDKSVSKDPAIEQAIENVNRRAAKGCDFYKSNSGGGI